MKYTELGKIVMDISPDHANSNPRNSEGAFLTVRDDEMIFVYSRYSSDSFSDAAAADLALLRSTDGGRSFREESLIQTCAGDGAINIMSVSLLEMKNGDIGLFYLVRRNHQQLQMYLRRSADGGRTWGEKILCTPVDGFFVVNNDRVTRLTGGRIIIPAARHAAAEGYFDPRSDAMFFYSDDDGETWEMADGKCSLPHSAYCLSGLQEPGLIELTPDHLWGWARTELGRQYEMFSFDGGESWTACQPSRFTSPCSPLCMKRGRDGTIYAVWNPIPQYNGREDRKIFTGGRTPLVIAASRDNGKTFSEPAAFETDETCGYCYCAIYFTKDCMMLAYCAGGEPDLSCLNKTRIRRVALSELENMFQ